MKNSVTKIHPDTVLEALLAKGHRSQRTGNLKKLHDICRRQYEGSRDYSLSAIGRLCEAEGILKGRVLYNAQSADYRAIIEAWSAYVGPVAKRPKEQKMLASYDYLMRIEDPAMRSIVQGVFAQRDKLKAELNLLKSQTTVVVDRRPHAATIALQSASDHQIQTVLEPFRLTALEREVLTKAISPDFLDRMGWREGAHGDIYKDKRVIYDPGYTKAIRRVVGV